MNVIIRPFAKEFLEQMSKHWNLMVFTASEQRYADIVVNMLDPEFIYFKNVCYRHQCDMQGPHQVKDLRSFTNAWLKIENILILDNRLGSFSFQPYNGLAVLPFYGDPQDSELKGLAAVCKQLAKFEVDIQQYVRDRYKFRKTLGSK